MRFLLTLVGVNLFILLNPFLLIAAVFWGSADEQELMRVVFWVAFPFTLWMWYLIVRFFTIRSKVRRGI